MSHLTIIHWVIFVIMLGMLILAVRLLLAMRVELIRAKSDLQPESRIQSEQVRVAPVSQPRHVKLVQKP